MASMNHQLPKKEPKRSVPSKEAYWMLNKNPFDKKSANAEAPDTGLAPSEAMKSMLDSKYPGSQGNPAVEEAKKISEDTEEASPRAKKPAKRKKTTQAKKAPPKTKKSKQLDDSDAEHLITPEKARDSIIGSPPPPFAEDGSLLEVPPKKAPYRWRTQGA